MTTQLNALILQHPELPHPVTYDAVADLVERLRADLALAEAVLLEMRADEIAGLEARLAALKAAALPAPKGKRGPKSPKPPTPMAEQEAPAPATTEPAAGAAAASDIAAIVTLTCPHCDFVSTSPHGVAVHIARRHKAPPAEPDAPVADAPVAPAPSPAPIELYTSEPRFICTRCASTAFASSVRDATICVRCDMAVKRLASQDAAPFVCKDCGRDTVAPAPTNPAICVQCARRSAQAAA